MSLLPKIAHAASNVDSSVNDIVSKITKSIVLPLVALIFALAVLLFIWGLFGFFMSGDDSAKRIEGRNHILWGTVGIAIMVSVYGIIRFVASSVGQDAVLRGFGL